jgi:hypothetical protein
MSDAVDCVDIRVDYELKRIEITIRIDFFLTDMAAPSPSEAERIKAIADGIVNRWNGHKFKCFDVVVTLDWRIIRFGEQRPNALPVFLDDDPTLSRSDVATERAGGKDDYLSDDPAARLDPTRGTIFGGNRWMLWGETSGHYAHELGHILGLDNGYGIEDGGRMRLPGHPEDIMFDSATGNVTPEMITKVIRRSGKVDEARVRCPISLDMGPMSWNLLLASINDIRVHAWACDYDPPTSDPSGRRPLQFKGIVSYQGEYLQQIGDPLTSAAPGWRATRSSSSCRCPAISRSRARASGSSAAPSNGAPSENCPISRPRSCT